MTRPPLSAFATQRRSPAAAQADPDGFTRRRRTLTALVVLGLWGLATHGTYAGSGDEPHYLAIAHSLAFDHDLDLTNNYGAAEPLIAGGALEPGDHIRRGRNGRVRPVHDVGLPVLLAPYVRVARPLIEPLLGRPDHPILKRLRLTPSTAYRHLLSAVMIVIAAVLARVMFSVFIAAGASQRVAFWTALLVALSPPLSIFAILLFTELTSALLGLLVFRRVALETRVSLQGWWLTGAAAGLLLLVHVRNVGLVAPLVFLGLLRLVRQRQVSHAVAFLVPLSLLVAARAAITYAFWGTYVTSPHARSGGWPGWPETFSIAGNRLGGLLLDQEFGLLPYAPVFILTGFGAAILWRTHRRLLLQLSGVIAFYVLLICVPSINAHGWTGGWSPVARFLTPVVPLLAIALCAGIPSAPRAVLIAVMAVQIAISAYTWQAPKSLWNDGDGVAAVCQRGPAAFCRFLPAFPPR
ncbi:MAG TPA: hypothetical protein VJ813_07095 [Vicinamibacterales bacterium]|nr:hypothetical protein [Vicinamibacterales bacterium]